MRLQKFFLSLICYNAFLFMGCNSSQSVEMDFSSLTDTEKQSLITRVQMDVDNKIPFQGSLIHQLKCDTLIALNHNVTGALQEKSTPYTKIGDYHIAFPYLEQAAELDPQDALYYYSWLLLYYYRDYDRAIFRLNQYDDFTPDQYDMAWGENVNYLKGLTYRQLGMYPKAIKEFSKAISDEGEHVDIYAYVYRGISYFLNGNYNKAISDFDHVILSDDNSSMAYYWKAESLVGLNNVPLAISFYDKASELVERGSVKTDSYMEVFDVPSIELIKDRQIELLK